MITTMDQYSQAIASCRDIFLKKTMDYGTSWRVYRTISIVDQIYIKAKRVRTIQEKKQQKIEDGITSEFQGIFNYAVIGLIQLEINNDDAEQLSVGDVEILYNQEIEQAKKLMMDKNHDYGEAWREMSQESYIDLILSKILRIKQILSNNGLTIMSEGIDANFFDILNYAAFGLIQINTGNHSK
jgi:hypothetical protein